LIKKQRGVKTPTNRGKLSVLIALVALATIWATGLMRAQQRGRPQIFHVPSDQFPTIQSAINAAVNGDRILVAPGVYNETLTIAKRVSLTGSGARGEGRTEIAGPRPTEVMPLDRAPGIINYQPGGGGKIEDLLIRGGHVGILGVAIEDRLPAPLEVKQVIIHQGVRGVAGSFSDLSVEECKVADMLWHGISILKATGKIQIAESVVELCLGIGCYVNNTEAGSGDVSLLNDTFGLNSGGGILIHGNAKPVGVTKCFVSNNRNAGIRLKDVGLAALCHNLINFTQPRLSDGKFGDGILAECSTDVIVCQDDQNFALDYLPPAIAYNARAGVSSFSSHISVTNVLFECNIFSAAGETVDPSVCSAVNKFSYDDGGGNQCSQITASDNLCHPVACQVATPGLEPPEPLPPH
jgi:hypothetical protein